MFPAVAGTLLEAQRAVAGNDAPLISTSAAMPIRTQSSTQVLAIHTHTCMMSGSGGLKPSAVAGTANCQLHMHPQCLALSSCHKCPGVASICHKVMAHYTRTLGKQPPTDKQACVHTCMMSGSGGLKPSAVAGGPSVTRLTHSSCTGMRPSGRPRMAVRKIEATCKRQQQQAYHFHNTGDVTLAT